MTNVIYNDNAKMLETNPANFVAVQSYRGVNFITAIGNDFAEVREEGNFHWSVMMDYEGWFEVLATSERNIKKN